MDDGVGKSGVFAGSLHLIMNDQELVAAFKGLGKVTALGFDTETRPSFRKGEVFRVALLQLASETDAYLIRLHFITQFGLIRELFENEQIVKAGVAIRDDLKQLQKVFKFIPQNFIELQDLAKERGLDNFGLKGMADEVLGLQVSKGPKLTNWEARELTDQQLKFAATDAWIGLQLYEKLKFESS